MSLPSSLAASPAPPASLGPDAVEPDALEPDEIDPAAEAIGAVQVGLYVSAVRCVLTYVVAPAAGALGVLLGPIGLVLQILGAITSTAGARRLWILGHRARYAYAAVAGAVVLIAAASLAAPVLEVLR